MNYRTASHPQGACPRCLEVLDKRDVGGMRVDVCAKCGGVFADKALTASMARGADRVVADAVFAFSVGKREWPREGVTAQLPCPECGMPMHREHVAPAVCDIDTCPEHGTWFDAHEATNVARALANARHRRHGG